MTDSEINLALAKALPDLCRADFTEDLNAIHKAARCLDTTIQQHEVCLKDIFASELEEIFSKSRVEPELWSMFDLVNATARQRAEAMLRTLNLWKE